MVGVGSGGSLLVLVITAFCFFSSLVAFEVTYDNRAIKIDGERKIILSGSIHYPRSTPEMWPSLIKKSKDGGLNAIETYVFWSSHEPQRRQYDFSGNLDLIRFLRNIQEQGLYAILRLGPFVCAEWNFGGLPVWLGNMPGVRFRTQNDVYTNEMKNFTTLIVDMIKRENLLASQGGPIILTQIENEYGLVSSSYGDEAKSYVNWSISLAKSFNVSVPWVMCQEWDAPEVLDTCNGWYCDQFYPKNPDAPKVWTENWTGWFNEWGGANPLRTAEDLAFAVARFFQYGGTLNNYYMYHGGTNFGRTAGGPYIATTYDYNSPLDEYGNPNQPKWGHLKQLHLVLQSIEKILTYGEVRNINYGNMMSATIYDLNGKRACFFGNANETNDRTITFEGKKYHVPAWSVSVLPDCQAEVYNTARVNTQTSVMVKHSRDSDEAPLKWTWRREYLEFLKGHPSNKRSEYFRDATSATQLMEQKLVTNDSSDYLWYMTSVDIDGNDPVWGKEEVTLQVRTEGHILHVFVNGRHMGSHRAKIRSYRFVFERSVKLQHGKNTIALLSATVGLPNAGAYYETIKQGIVGPVMLIGTNNQAKDLSTNKWVYKVGLHGEAAELFRDDAPGHHNWLSENLPINRSFVWYKTTFKSPSGQDPVVLDLLGLGKGAAWVNGHHIGRYWPSYLAPEDGCSSTCDYRGKYNPNKCLSNCGKSSQRWYHVPRSFLRDEGNSLVLFEEFGGNPTLASVQTVTVGKACGNAYEGNTLELLCQGGRVISEVKFASFGDPKGNCESFETGSCESPNSLSVVENLLVLHRFIMLIYKCKWQACVGKESCSIDVSEETFGPSGCHGSIKRLAVEAIC
ncbi:hypothetical protein RJ640_020375 [Escallonia rubra]|uniref:Beta-galactosidase n=2 Tax=Escallonia rubra TaxID=112253 RepID=A0AA88QNU3_9ASTE|nr:hypothetical protein RJ640_020375 [Escallonia rubra]